MIPILAQHSPSFDAGQLYTVAGVLIFLLMAVLLVRKVFGHTPPLHKEYVSREEHAAFAKKMDDELGRERGARKAIHQEISALQGSVDVVKTQNSQQSAALHDLKAEQGKIRDRIDDIPQRMITLLRSSGILK